MCVAADLTHLRAFLSQPLQLAELIKEYDLALYAVVSIGTGKTVLRLC